jgi:methionine-rich copper-binding protein CopC
MKRLTTAALLAVLALFVTAPAAWAHTELTASNPAEGAQVATPPTQLTLTFTEPVDPAAATVKVTGADGTAWAVGPITATDATLTAPVTPAGQPGQYTIDYTITSADGDPVSGAVKFTLTTAVPPPTTSGTTTTTTDAPADPPAPAPAAQSTDAGSGGLPAWVWIVLAVALVAAAVVAVLVRRSSTRPTE